MYLIFDTETTGLPKNYNAPVTDGENWPRLVQLAWQLHDEKGDLVEVKNFIVKPEGFTIPFNSEQIQGISTERANKEGVSLAFVLEEFTKAVEQSKFCVGHNVIFDMNIMGAEYYRKGFGDQVMTGPTIDTKDTGTNYCAIPGGRGGKFKWPTLMELHTKLFNEGFNEAHNASADVEATARCFLEMVRIDVIGMGILQVEKEIMDAFRANNPSIIQLLGLNIQPYAPINESDEVEERQEDKSLDGNEALDVAVSVSDITAPFIHLHNHSQFSVLQSTSEIGLIAKTAKKMGMPAVALTDIGNMFAAYHFLRDCKKEEIIGICGCDFHVAIDRTVQKFTKDNPDRRFSQVLLAKNKKGFHNLAKLASTAYIDGLYAGYPRIDKTILPEYKGDLMALTGGLNGEVPNLILNVGEDQAEEALLWWKEQFGEDLYIELMRHGLPEEEHVNKVLMGFARKHDIKVVAANKCYYIEKENANAHDILLCVKDGEQQSTPIGKGRGFRYGLANDEYYFKSQEEMKELFTDIPEAIENLSEIIGKCESYTLGRDVLLPEFEIPEKFIDPEDKKDGGKRGENAFLRDLTYKGAEKRYGEITPELVERLDFELLTIANSGYPGYFLIVQDFTTEARNMGVSVGPGRGSAAGSVVAYCIGITNVDPIEYDLLFERFLNPDRVSLPDIDIDFDDVGRGKIIDWVMNKYGQTQVAQIITYGTMAAKSSIRDTARVLDLPLWDADRIAKLVPDTSLNKIFNLPPEKLAEKLNADQMVLAKELQELAKGVDLSSQVVQQAIILEGSVRNTGTHACGVIITPDDITNYIPVSLAKDSDMLVTQFDNSVVEDAGMLKMDFLGLKTLTIIKDAIAMIKKNHGVEIITDDIPLDDEKTYELYQKGLTNGTFQFESGGMQKHLVALKPDKFADLIAMNALYRPGPIEYIPNFIARKHGEEEIVYDLDGMEEFLAETYGITVYQEQVMRLSQKIGGFSKGDADMLRKAMGKKIFALLEKMKPQFIAGGIERGHKEKMLNKVWSDWEAFAAYAFNKSHSTCYSVVAFHTAYLKAHYPAEYMASVLTHNQSNIEKVTFFMEECKNLGVKVLGPDINESGINFEVNSKGEIRFGLGAIKGTGETACEEIINIRNEKGRYLNMFDFAEKVNLRTVNKKTFESIAQGGGFDCFPTYHRRQFLYAPDGEKTLIEKVIMYGNKLKQEAEADQVSMFGGDSGVEISKPIITPCEPYGQIEQLNIEKEVVGFYISGHPLDEFKLEVETFCTCTVDKYEQYQGRPIKLAGIITKTAERMTKRGAPFGLFSVEDYGGGIDMALFGEDYLKLRHFLKEGEFIFMHGKVEERYKQPGQWEFKPLNIELLSEVRDKLCQGINISLDLNKLDTSLITDLEAILSENEGSSQVRFSILDHIDRINVEMYSKRFKVQPSDKLIASLKEIEGIHNVKVIAKK